MAEARQSGYTQGAPIIHSKEHTVVITEKPPEPLVLLLTAAQEELLRGIIKSLESMRDNSVLVLPEDAKRIPEDINAMKMVKILESKGRVIYVEGIPSSAVIL